MSAKVRLKKPERSRLTGPGATRAPWSGDAARRARLARTPSSHSALRRDKYVAEFLEGVSDRRPLHPRPGAPSWLLGRPRVPPSSPLQACLGPALPSSPAFARPGAGPSRPSSCPRSHILRSHLPAPTVPPGPAPAAS